MSDSYFEAETSMESTSARMFDENSGFEPTATPNSFNEFDFITPTTNLNKTTAATTTMATTEHEMKYTYPTLMTNPNDRENWTISTDHCYARPWNWRPEASFLRPTKTLFIPKVVATKRKSSNPLAPLQECDDVVDVESVPEPTSPVYDAAKAKLMMDNCDKVAGYARPDNTDDDWDEAICKIDWTPTEKRLLSSMMTILDSFQMARLAQTGAKNEPLLRRCIIDKCVQRVRRLLATVVWDTKLTQWLHLLLIENLSAEYLSSYLDILMTLRAKLPNFVDKMIGGQASTSRLGVLNNESLFTLLKRQWDPVAASLLQDKPKKLPGNPIIIVVPSAPVMSKRIQKWVANLSNLASVVTVPINFGVGNHRMSMLNCLDQMFATTRGKIQKIRLTYPGRQIILLGFNAGGTLAMQVAQVEPVLCVISLGFSLLTAEGKRGEPDDSLLELQSPVLFVIGQCSNTSFQEDVEDLRERMRVETGLIVVGSADDNLRVSKRKKKAEGITQSIVDRCIIDEIGEFISGLILSPFPPQFRQSPIPTPTDSKKSKVERKRYNSNASSLDSEPPSPTPRITRPGSNNSPTNLGRPPGSKSKSRLEAKWAAQIAQGTPFTPSPSASPPPLVGAALNTPDTSSNDSSLTDKPPITYKSNKIPTDAPPPLKKLKTLKPVVTAGADKTLRQTAPNSSPSKNQTPPLAKIQAYGLNRSVVTSGPLSTLLQGGIKTIPPSQPKSSVSGIKVLENVQLNSATAGKLISNSGCTIDLSKITLINSVSTSGKVTANALGNVVLLPNGKLKTVGSSVKGTGGTPILLPNSGKNLATHSQVNYPGKINRGKYITSKRQLIGNKPPRPVKKLPYIPTSSSSALPPPTNLTTQDIMDLPIIFADDNQIIDNSVAEATTSSAPPPTPKIISSTPGSKFVLVNKQANPGNFIITPSIKKPNPIVVNKQPPKFTKIILSKRTGVDDGKGKAPSDVSAVKPEITTSTFDAAGLEEIDLENELVATAVPKPNLITSDVKNITIFTKKSGESLMASLGFVEDSRKRSLPVDLVNKLSNPEPPKIVKLND